MIMEVTDVTWKIIMTQVLNKNKSVTWFSGGVDSTAATFHVKIKATQVIGMFFDAWKSNGCH